ncbi:MAG TPA: hypothetical protein VFW00_05770 [Rhodocyclaceae bacterium]|nr:hypothetical protein [Rhodocyclaceae bacterium]
MAKKKQSAPKDPLQRLRECAIVAGGMALVFLVLTRGKVLTALILALFFFDVLLRFKRAAERDS